ncbi:MAG: hypothetical protein AAF415_12520 [Pseudomonadota bacterium]
MANLKNERDVERLIMNIVVQPDGRRLLRSLEVFDNAKRMRFSFVESTLREVLSIEALASINDLLDGILGNGRAIISSDVAIQLKNLILEGCNIMISAGADGAENVMIRFKHYHGRILSLFSDTFAYRDSVADRAVETATDILTNIYMPLFDLSQYIDQNLSKEGADPQPELAEALTRINKKIKELQFHRMLLINCFGAGYTGDSATPTLEPPKVEEWRIKRAQAS